MALIFQHLGRLFDEARACVPLLAFRSLLIEISNPVNSYYSDEHCGKKMFVETAMSPTPAIAVAVPEARTASRCFQRDASRMDAPPRLWKYHALPDLA